MGRKPAGQDVKARYDAYMADYELDSLNDSNDAEALMQMCQLEVYIAKLQKALDGVKDLAADAKIVKDLSTSLKDTRMSWNTLQQSLGIDRKKRVSENEETPLSYIDRLKDEAKTFVDRRLSVLKCKDCSMPLAKYFIYFDHVGEPGSVEAETVAPEPTSFTLSVECPRCRKNVTVSQEEQC